MPVYKLFKVIEVTAESAEEALAGNIESNVEVETKIGFVAARQCTECAMPMSEGYLIGGGEAYYCGDECLHKNMSPEEWEELYDNGNSDSMFTTWEDENDVPQSELPKLHIEVDGGLISSISTNMVGIDISKFDHDIDEDEMAKEYPDELREHEERSNDSSMEVVW
jgi:hypothetical protein